MKEQTAVIIVDTGFSLESLIDAGNIVAVKDLSTGFTAIGSPFLNFEASDRELRQFAHDPLNHGSLVLKVLSDLAPSIPVVLVRAYSDDVRMIRTGFSQGVVETDGWTEAYKWAVELCIERGLNSVANCSFGAYTHAMDGTGWEAHCLRQLTGCGKPGHVVVAGAGSGDGRNIHASWNTASGESTDVFAQQKCSTTYNFWSGISTKTNGCRWALDVYLNGEQVAQFDSEHIGANFWNNAKQLTFTVYGVGEVRLHIRSAQDNGLDSSRFDCWINHQDDAHFTSHGDSNLVAEPACFAEVIAVGLKGGKYAPEQTEADSKPDVLLEGGGPVSFRLPEVVVQVVNLLNEDSTLDAEEVRQRLLTA